MQNSTPPQPPARTSRRRWWVLFGSLALVMVLVAAGITTWLLWPPKHNRAPFDQAVKNLAAAQGVRYQSSTGGVAWDVRVTANGELVGSMTVVGKKLGLLTVGGKTYVKSPDGLIPGAASSIRPSALRGKWVTGDTGSSGAVLAQAMSPAKLASNLRGALARTKRFPTVDDPGTQINGTAALKASTPAGDVYVSKNAPHQVLRFVPADRAKLRLPPLPKMPSLVGSQYRAAVHGPSPPPSPSSEPSSEPDGMDVDPMSPEEVDDAYEALQDSAEQLSDSVDASIDFQLRGGAATISCGPGGCTVTAAVTNSVSVTGGTIAGGTVSAQLTATMIINDLPAGSCANVAPLPLNGAGSIACQNPAAGAVFVQADAAAKARAEASAAPGTTYTWTIDSRAQVEIVASAQVNVKKLVEDLENNRDHAAAAAETLPKLTGSIAESFEGGSYATQTYKAGTMFYRAEGADQGIGSFFGLAKPATAADAEKMYNIAKWGNNAQVVSTYRLTQDTTMYVGDVAGGTGQQVLLPRGTSATSVFQQVGQEPLP
ncbi:MAG: hypothetical protein ACR2J5_12115 [Geodermatophilaceae bacterium]